MQLPKPFEDDIRSLIGDEYEAFVQALEQKPPVSIRINPNKPIEKQSIQNPVPWSKTGYYLAKRPSFTFDPLFHAGTYYVQEASSMFVEQVFKQYLDADLNILDLCAAPGGKSTHIASMLSADSLLVSNEVIRSRANILAENITKAGYPNVIVTNNDPAQIGNLNHFFDVILVDAPCSGEGMFRKDNKAIEEWSPANVRLCKERQQRIVGDVWDALKPGGILIYSTCTYNRSENEDNIIWICDNLGAETLALKVGSEWNIHPSYDADVHAYHFFPHKAKGEGFFLSALRKNEGEINRIAFPKKDKKGNNKKPNILAKDYQQYIIDYDDYIFFDKDESWFAFPKKQYDDFRVVIATLRLVSAGIYMGEVKGKDFIPHHSLAMSLALYKDSFVVHEVDKDKAITYLRKEAMSFPYLPKGYILLTYQQHVLGFIKNIGNRANNLYPNEWRIRSSYLPDQ